MVSYKPQAGQKKIPAAASRMAGGSAPYSDEILGTALRKQMNMPFDLLLGRKTFDIWAAFWPQHADDMAGRQHGDQVRRLEYHDFSANGSRPCF